jgi:hypothetical protein
MQRLKNVHVSKFRMHEGLPPGSLSASMVRCFAQDRPVNVLKPHERVYSSGFSLITCEMKAVKSFNDMLNYS